MAVVVAAAAEDTIDLCINNVMGLGMPKLLRTAILQSVSTGQNSSGITLFMQRSIVVRIPSFAVAPAPQKITFCSCSIFL
jgi:hypothetical protein